MFIVIDGIDGSGKGTQVQILKKYFENIGKKVKILDYPRYGEKSAFMVEKYLNGEYPKNISPKLASIFYAIDRYDSFFGIKNKIDLENYDYVISNRYVSASMIHQAGKIKSKKEAKKFLDWLYDLEYNIFGIPKPDKIFFLSVTPEISQELILKKEKRNYIKNSNNIDVFEKDIEHMKDSYNKAKEIVSMYDDWIEINCVENEKMLSKEKITKKILDEIKK